MKTSFLRRLFAKCYTQTLVRRCRHTTAEGLSYLLRRHDESDVLVVSFPGCTRPARFNYVFTLRKLACHRLYLLDNYAENGLGNYLMRPDVVNQVHSLIRELSVELKITRLVFVGSSKGGSSALFYGFQFPDTTLCIAAPQYFLGDYLWDGIEYRQNLADILQKSPTPEGIEELNVRISNLIEKSALRPQQVFLHYSDCEHTYAEHVRPLLDDLHRHGIPVEEDVAHYHNHGDLRYYYPVYLRRTIQQILAP